MKIAWVHYPIYGSGITAKSGIARGYLSSAWAIYNALKQELGGDLVDVGVNRAEHPRIHLHYCPPHLFRPVAGKVNAFFSMWEAPILPPEMARAVLASQVAIVPSRYCQKVWKTNTDRDAIVAPLGVPAEYQLCDASRPTLVTPDRVLRFLWVGSKIARKGWPILAPAWLEAFGPRARHDVRLTVKTIGEANKITQAPGGLPVFLDERDLEAADMLKLYLEHDVIVGTSYGEGFGLPALEAMAAGCLYVGSDATGLSEFVKDTTAIVVPRTNTVRAQYGPVAFEARILDPKVLGRALGLVARDWGTSMVEALRQHGTVFARRFSWTQTAQTLLAGLAEYRESGNVVPFDRTNDGQAVYEGGSL